MAGILQIDNPQLSAIKDLLALVALKAQWDNGLHLGNINSSLEEIVRRLLNTVFDLKLINLNYSYRVSTISRGSQAKLYSAMPWFYQKRTITWRRSLLLTLPFL